MTEFRFRGRWVLFVPIVLASVTADAQAPTFGSQYDIQRVEIKDSEGRIHRVVTLTRRQDGDYDVRSLDVTRDIRLSGLLRNQGEGRFEGDIFDTASGTLRGVRVIETETGVMTIDETDYASGDITSGEIRCVDRQCTYRRR